MDFIDITQDGKVKKAVIKEGYGEQPPLHSRCFVHYVGRIVDSGDEFMNTEKENGSGQPATIVAGRGKLLSDYVIS